MIGYTLLASTSAQELVNNVTSHAKKGWVPQGGICTRTLNKFECELMQAMIKESKDD